MAVAAPHVHPDSESCALVLHPVPSIVAFDWWRVSTMANRLLSFLSLFFVGFGLFWLQKYLPPKVMRWLVA